MNISGIKYPTINEFPVKVLQDFEMKQISTSIGEMNNAHEQRKEEIDEINQQTYS